VLESGGTWLGMTHRSDRDEVRAKLRSLVAAGRYPERLW
jgi:hypothetical protein